MKKAMRYTMWLGLYIVVLFTAAIFLTYISEALQASGFFGDSLKEQRAIRFSTDAVDDAHYWGARHYWYWWGCLLLFLLSIVRIIIWSYYYWDSETK